MKPRILVVDDEPDLLELLEMNLSAVGFIVLLAQNGPEALRKARENEPALILLDVVLPGMDGLEVCRCLRQDVETKGIPILMLTARADEIDRVLGLELGADDYMTKPFSMRELVLRVRNLLRVFSATATQDDVTQLGSLKIDRSRHRITVKGLPVEMTLTEFNLVALLAQCRGRVQSRRQLLREVWGHHNITDTRTIDTHMRRLRAKLGPAADYLDTVRGVGYRLREE